VGGQIGEGGGGSREGGGRGGGGDSKKFRSKRRFGKNKIRDYHGAKGLMAPQGAGPRSKSRASRKVGELRQTSITNETVGDALGLSGKTHQRKSKKKREERGSWNGLNTVQGGGRKGIRR